MNVLFGCATVVAAATLLLLLYKPGQTRALSVWLLAALLPIVVAVSSALNAQTNAQHVLSTFDAAGTQDLSLSWLDAAGDHNTATVALSSLDAACVVRAVNRGGNYQLSSGTLFIPRGAQLSGPWPSQAQSDALMVSGKLSCHRLESSTLSRAGTH